MTIFKDISILKQQLAKPIFPKAKNKANYTEISSKQAYKCLLISKSHIFGHDPAAQKNLSQNFDVFFSPI